MTMFSANETINNLRRARAELEDRLNEVKGKVREWDTVHSRDRHAAPSILVDLEKLLGLPQEKS